MTGVSDELEYWQKLAKDARVKAEQISHPRSRQTILKLADNYERMAKEKLPGPKDSIESRAQSLALSGMTSDDGGTRREHTIYTDEADLLNREQNAVSGTRTSFGPRRKLVLGTGIAAALGVCACAYFLLTSSNDKTEAQSAEVSAAVQAVPASVVQIGESGTSAETASSSVTQARPTEPADASQKKEAVYISQKKAPVEASQKVGSAALTTSTEPLAPARTEDILFLQRPNVNIRSTPSISSSVVGTAAKGTRFKVMSRDSDWVQVQNGRLKGWINAQLLAPIEPR
jgi:Bacterial SH3 domain